MKLDGPKLSKIGVGLSQLNNQLYGYKKYSNKHINNLINYAIDKGINVFDTAHNYGDTEKILEIKQFKKIRYKYIY